MAEVFTNELTTGWPQLLGGLVAQNCGDAKTPEKIAHISKILFHARKSNEDQQDLEQQEILKEVFLWLKKHYNAKLAMSDNKIASIVWPLPAKLPKVSILIPTRDQVELLKKLVTGLLTKTDYPDIEILIVDNESIQTVSKAYFSEIQKDPRVKVVSYPQAFNYSAINNFGFKSCTGEILALLNNDIEVMRSDWLLEAVREALAPQVGAVGAKLYYKNGFIQHAGVVLGPHGAGHIHSYERRNSAGYLNRLQFSHELSAVTAACMIMRSEVFSKVSGFNEKDLPVAYNDIDLCIRIRELGLKIIWTPKVELYHLESASRPPDTRLEQIARYRREVEYMFTHWGPKMQHCLFNATYQR